MTHERSKQRIITIFLIVFLLIPGGLLAKGGGHGGGHSGGHSSSGGHSGGHSSSGSHSGGHSSSTSHSGEHSSSSSHSSINSGHSSSSQGISNSGSGNHNAKSGISKSSSSSQKVHVKGYYRKDGTYVKGYDRSLPSRSSSSTTMKSSAAHTSKNTSANTRRDKNGKSKRSEKARADFMKKHPCPSTGKMSGACPGYVVDHITPLKRGGADSPSNMQWQSVEAAKAKDKWE